jgi:chaperone modulatory protein CbpM
MHNQPSDWHRLDTGVFVSIQELSYCCRLEVVDLLELVEYGALDLADGDGSTILFHSDCVAPLRTASRLRADFDLDLFTTGLLLGYLRRIGELEQQIASIQARAPAHVAHARHEPGPWHEEHARAGGAPKWHS